MVTEDKASLTSWQTLASLNWLECMTRPLKRSLPAASGMWTCPDDYMPVATTTKSNCSTTSASPGRMTNDGGIGDSRGGELKHPKQHLGIWWADLSPECRGI